MASYRFVTVWRLEAPIDRVFSEIDAAEAWPEWWPMVKAVQRLEDARPDGTGALYRMTFVGKLPYRLEFDMRVTRRVVPMSIVGDAVGELEGVGDWALHEEGSTTVVRYVWAIRTTRAWMNLFAPLPFVDAIFRLNHHAVMRNGLRGIRARLGGVAGTYIRED